MRKLAEKVKELKLQNEALISTNVWMYHFVPMPLEHEGDVWFKVLWSRNRMKSIKPGDIMIWDPYYSDRWGHELSLLKNEDQWKELFYSEHKDSPIGGIFKKL